VEVARDATNPMPVREHLATASISSQETCPDRLLKEGQFQSEAT